MSKIMITAKPQSGLSLSSDRGHRMPEILDYIPGSALRGAIAAMYLRHYHQDDGFLAFDNGINIFPDLLPSQKTLGQVIPKTAFSCKRNPGFEDDAHGVFDHLFLGGASNMREISREQIEVYFDCPVQNCQQPLKNYSGYLSDSHSVRIDKGFRVHVGIDRLSGTSSPDILYALESLQPSLDCEFAFCGLGKMEDEFIDKLEELQKKQPTLFVGKAKTRGYGEIEWHIERIEEDENRFEENLESFDRAFRDFCGNEPFSLELEDDDFYFSIGMNSNAIIVDRWLRYSADSDNLIDVLKLPQTSPVYEVASLVLMRGWNQKHRLPKESEYAIQRGSVYLMKTENREAMIPILRTLANFGCGLRREEGYGRLIISNSFHQGVNVCH